MHIKKGASPVVAVVVIGGGCCGGTAAGRTMCSSSLHCIDV